MVNKPVADLDLYKKQFEKMKSKYIACLVYEDLQKIKTKINALQANIAGLGEEGQDLQTEISQFLSEQKFKVTVRRNPLKITSQMLDLLNGKETPVEQPPSVLKNPLMDSIRRREKKRIVSPSTARNKDKPKDIKYIK